MAQFAPMIAAAAIKFIGQSYQGEAEGTRLNSMGDVAQANAKNTRLQTNASEETQRRHNAVRMGDLRARAAQSGFDASTGSLADLQVKSAGEMELDALTTRYQGQLEAIGFDNQAAGYRASAKNARRSGYLSAFGTLASSAANYMSAGMGSGGGG